MILSETLMHIALWLGVITALSMAFAVMRWKRSGFVIASTILTFVMGITLIVTGIMAKESNGLIHADELVVANSSGNISILTLATMMIIFGIIVVLASVSGALGSIKKNKFMIAFYTCTTLAFGIYFFVTGFSLESFAEESGPQIRRQIVDMCNEETYEILYKKLMCSSSTDGHSDGLVVQEDSDARTQCNGACAQRLEFLQWRLGGCSTLTYMCSTNSYALMASDGSLWRKEDTVDSGECRLRKNQTPATSWVGVKAVEHSHCRTKCNMDLDCRGFNYNTTSHICTMISPNEPAKAKTAWTAVYGDSSEYGPLEEVEDKKDVQCFIKTTSRIVTRLLNFINGLAGITMLLGVSLGFGSFAGISMVCSQRRGQEGKNDNLCTSMLCPFMLDSDDDDKHETLVDVNEAELEAELSMIDNVEGGGKRGQTGSSNAFSGDRVYSASGFGGRGLGGLY